MASHTVPHVASHLVLMGDHAAQPPAGQPQPDGVITLTNADGSRDFVGCCATHEQASHRFVFIEDAERWRCPVCLLAFSRERDLRWYRRIRSEVLHVS